MTEAGRAYSPDNETASQEQLAIDAQIERQPLVDFEELRQTLQERVATLQKQFKVKHRNLLRWARKQGYTLHILMDTASRMTVTGGMVGSLLAGVPQIMVELPQSLNAPPSEQASAVESTDASGQVESRRKDQMTAVAVRQQQVAAQDQAIQELWSVSQQQLTLDQADQVAAVVSELTGVPAVAELEGYRLNTNVGRIGAEQHLYRYPGDNPAEHFESVEERRQYEASGFAPGLGAYGYFAPSQSAMTAEQAEKEKYYVAVQTFMSPNWAGNVNETYNWFKHRKVIVYHPETQKAVVAVVGDAGPALSTGKNFGGSPEVMGALQARDGYGTPPVMVFFVEDTAEHPIPLGPIDFKLALLE